jgi:dipeptidyl aminopeptidase/acylaminoacyl peptidase
MQGDADPSIPIEESKRYVNAARTAGIETAYHILKNADHNFSSVSHFNTIFKVTTSWAKERFL